MRSRSVLSFIAAVLSLTLWAQPVSAASTSYPIHLTKDCATLTGVAHTYCTIRDSSLTTIPVGSRIWYDGPVLTDPYFVSSQVMIDDGNGSTATGYCIFVARTSKGLCTYWEGTGRLAGFHAIFDVSVDAAGLFNLDGEYFFAADARPSPDTASAPTTLPSSGGPQPWR